MMVICLRSHANILKLDRAFFARKSSRKCSKALTTNGGGGKNTFIKLHKLSLFFFTALMRQKAMIMRPRRMNKKESSRKVFWQN